MKPKNHYIEDPEEYDEDPYIIEKDLPQIPQLRNRINKIKKITNLNGYTKATYIHHKNYSKKWNISN